MRLMRVVGLQMTVAMLGACVGGPPVTQTGVPQSPPGVQAVSLLGDSLIPPRPPDETPARQLAQLEEAWNDYRRDLNDVDAAIWYGRRLAYLGYYREAIAVYSDAISLHPDDARLYRHRGHRYITIRKLREAIEDFSTAAKLVQGLPDQVEPDGQPNERGIPTSTLHSNIWYHLGLAHYLRGDFERAASSYREYLKVANNPDALVAGTYWMYMILRRMGEAEEAASFLEPITADMDIIENTSYYRLLLVFNGALSPDSLLGEGSQADGIGSVTVGYGIGNWHYFNSRQAQAEAIWRSILDEPQWAGFGYIAAEAEIARLTDGR